MYVIVDSNIIYRDPTLKSSKSQALFGYLHKTGSRLLIPNIVKQEIVANYKKQVHSSFMEIQKLKGLLLDGETKIGISLDMDKEVSDYQYYIESLIREDKITEIPYQNEFLDEVVKRAIWRIKPANSRGQQFRDVIIWLSIKEYMKDVNMRQAAFISEDMDFQEADQSGVLHHDLVNELSKEGLTLGYFNSLDAFLRTHSQPIEFMTKQWVQDRLSKIQLAELVSEAVARFSGWGRFEESGNIWTGYVSFLGFRMHEVRDFYVYGMTNTDIYLNAEVRGELSVEMEFESDSPSRAFRRSFITKAITSEISIEVECKVRNEKLVDINIEIL